MSRTLLLVALIAVALAACGNKGPLVLPDAQDKAQPDKSKDAAKKDAQPATANRH